MAEAVPAVGAPRVSRLDRRKARTRQALIDAAVRLIAEGRGDRASIQEITEEADIGFGSFYNHFDSKEALAVVALQRYGTTRRLAELGDASVPALDRLRAHFEFLRGENEGRDYTRGCLIGDFGTEISDHSPVIRAAVESSLHAWGDALAGAIADGQRAGSIRSGLDPKIAARFVLNAWEGTLISMRAERSGAAFDDFFEIVFGTLLA